MTDRNQNTITFGGSGVGGAASDLYADGNTSVQVTYSPVISIPVGYLGGFENDNNFHQTDIPLGHFSGQALGIGFGFDVSAPIEGGVILSLNGSVFGGVSGDLHINGLNPFAWEWGHNFYVTAGTSLQFGALGLGIGGGYDLGYDEGRFFGTAGYDFGIVGAWAETSTDQRHNIVVDGQTETIVTEGAVISEPDQNIESGHVNADGTITIISTHNVTGEQSSTTFARDDAGNFIPVFSTTGGQVYAPENVGSGHELSGLDQLAQELTYPTNPVVSTNDDDPRGDGQDPWDGNDDDDWDPSEWGGYTDFVDDLNDVVDTYGTESPSTGGSTSNYGGGGTTNAYGGGGTYGGTAPTPYGGNGVDIGDYPDNDPYELNGGGDEHSGHDGGRGDADGRPVILDLDGDGVEITFGSDGATFDMDGDGYLEQTSWAAADDGFLVIDLAADGSVGNGDGIIDQAEEIAFSLWTDTPDATDLQALAEATHADGTKIFDSNDDGILDANDTIWGHLHVWQDLDQDGVTDEGELRTLADWGITSINLSYDDGTAFDDTSNDISVFGNALFGLGSYTMVDEDGNTVTVEGGVGDVALSYNTQGWRRVETAIGYSIEFEGGGTLNYAVLDGSGTTSVDLVQDWLDGATGDGRDNALLAGGHTLSVQVSGGDGDDTISGGYADDMLSGDTGNDAVFGGGGSDVIFFDALGDTIHGGTGVDHAIFTGTENLNLDIDALAFEMITAGDGNDTLSGGQNGAQVTINGGDGRDHITAGQGDDWLIGGNGGDLIDGGAGGDVILGDNGADTLRGGNGDDQAYGGADADHMNGQAGDDQLFGGDGDDTVHGAAGDDRIFGGSDADNVWGWEGDDQVFGGDGADVVAGHQGDDLLFGGKGNDTLHGGYGDDVVFGGDGHDLFHDSFGDDRYLGGDGNDVFSLSIYGGQNIVQGGLAATH